MTDLWLAAGWMGWLGLGIGAVVLLHRRGLPGTTARDLVHVGAGSWVLGWPWWEGTATPLSIVYAAVLGASVVPWVGGSWSPVAAIQRALAEGDERWTGVVLYTVSAALFTTLGLLWAPLPAGAALLALALGDGLGGAVGLRWGRHRYQLPGGKARSFEGSVAVGLFSSLAVFLAAVWLGPMLPLAVVLTAGLLAAIAEAVSPRATDNLLLPLTVWGWLTLTT